MRFNTVILSEIEPSVSDGTIWIKKSPEGEVIGVMYYGAKGWTPLTSGANSSWRIINE